MAKRPVDWEAVSYDWANPHLTLDEIAARHGISKSRLWQYGRARQEEGVWPMRPRRKRGRRTKEELEIAQKALTGGDLPPVDGVYIAQYDDSGRELPPKSLKPTPQHNRTTIYTKKIGERICDLIAQGWALKQVCSLPDMPAMHRVLKWVRSTEHKDFARDYWAAREAALHLDMDDFQNELVEITKQADKAGSKLSTAQIQALQVRRQHLEFKLSSLMSEIFRKTGRNFGRNSDPATQKSAVQGLAAVARKGTAEMEQAGVIDRNSRRVNLKVVNGGKA